MPPKNVAAPNAVKLFHCKICDKGYPRQTEYENHLRSYDHNHRQRLAEMKKITAANDSDNTRTGKRGLEEMRSIPIEGAGARTGMGRGFRKVGVDTSTGGGSGFKKVGVVVDGAPSGLKKVGVTTSTTSAPSGFRKVGVTAERSASHSVAVTKTYAEPVPIETVDSQESPSRFDSDFPEDDIKALMMDLAAGKKADSELHKNIEDDEDEDDFSMDEEEYDFRKPTGCDHATCPGCRITGVSH